MSEMILCAKYVLIYFYIILSLVIFHQKVVLLFQNYPLLPIRVDGPPLRLGTVHKMMFICLNFECFFLKYETSVDVC